MNYDYEFLFKEQQYKDRLEDAEKDRLAREAKSAWRKRKSKQPSLKFKSKSPARLSFQS